MEKKGAPIKASFFYILASILQQGINFITTPIFTRTLPVSAYGVVSVFNSWMSLLAVIVTLTLWGGVFNNGMTEFPKDRQRFTYSIMQLILFNSLVALVLSIVFRQPLSNLMQIPALLVYFMVIRIAADGVLKVWMAEQRYEYKYKIVFLISVAVAFLNPILGLYAIYLYPNHLAQAKIIASAIPTLIIAAVLFIAYFFKIRKLAVTQYWKYALKFNVPLIPHYLSSIVLNHSDKIMISYFCGSAQAGIYNVAYSLAGVVTVIFTALNGAFVPFIYQCLKSNRHQQLSKSSNILVALVAFGCLTLIAVAPELIRILAPEEYYQAVWCVPPVAVGLFCTFLYNIYANVELYYKKNLFVMVASITAAVVNIVLNFLFIPKYGFIAAAYTTLISYVFLSVEHYIYTCKNIKENVYNIKFIGLTFIALVLLGVVAMLLYNNTFIRWSIIVFVAVVCLFNLKKIVALVKSSLGIVEAA